MEDTISLIHVLARGGNMRTIFRSFAVAALLLLQGGLATGAQAQVQTAPPAGMTQEQFNALVDAISTSVSEKLKAEGSHVPAVAPAPPPASAATSDSKGGKASKPPPAPKIIKMPPKEGPDGFAVFFERANKVLKATPVMLG